MRFIKNNTIHTAKVVLTSSVLILNGNMCSLDTPPKFNQAVLQPSTAHSTMSNSQEQVQGNEKELVSKLCNEAIDLCNKFEEILPNGQSSDTMSSKEEPIYEEINLENKGYESGYQTEDEDYDEPWDMEKEHIYDQVAEVDMDTKPYQKINTQPSQNRHLVSDL